MEYPPVLMVYGILSNSPMAVFLVVLLLALCLMHYFLVHRKQKDKTFWKRADYLWIVSSIFAIMLGYQHSQQLVLQKDYEFQDRELRNVLSEMSEFLDDSYGRHCIFLNGDQLTEDMLTQMGYCQDTYQDLVFRRAYLDFDREVLNKPRAELFVDSEELDRFSREVEKSYSETDNRVVASILRDKKRFINLMYSYNWTAANFNLVSSSLMKYRNWEILTNTWVIILAIACALRLTKVSGEIMLEGNMPPYFIFLGWIKALLKLALGFYLRFKKFVSRIKLTRNP